MPNQTKHNHKTDDNFDDKIIYNEAEKSSALANNGCGVCQRKGFPLFLVRKAVVLKNYQSHHWSANIVNLGANEKPLSDVYEYAYRTLRTGYVYILVKEQDGTYRYLAYEVTPSGVFRHKSIEDMIEHNIHEIPEKCTAKNDHISGVFINIDRSRYSGVAYVGYSRRAWSKPALDKYRLAAEKADDKQLARFTKINLGEMGSMAPSPSELGSAHSPSRCFAFNEFDSLSLKPSGSPKLMEIELDQSNVMYIDPAHTYEEMLATKQYNSDCFITAHKFNSFKGNSLLFKIPYLSGVNSVRTLFRHAATLGVNHHTDISAVVIDDPFAIAEELCLQQQLFIEPIINIIENGTADFNKQVTDIFKQRINGQKDIDKLDKLIKQTIYNYYENYPKEAAAIYGEDKKEVLSETELDEKETIQQNKASYFYELYAHTSSIYLQPYEKDKEYFSEESIHLRKVAEMIEHYKTQITDYFQQSEQYKYIQTYSTEVKSGDGTVSNDPGDQHASYPDLYEEQDINQNDRYRLLEEIESQNVPMSGVQYTGVRVFKFKSGISQNGVLERDKELAKVEKHIEQKKIDQFKKTNNAYFSNIAKNIEKYSTDYFNYLGWLFGAEKQGSPYLPKLTQFNQIAFWLDECDVNGSNNHLGYLQDFIAMTDFTIAGGVPLPEQYGAWDVLLSNKETLFYQLFNTDENNSLWHLLIEARYAQDDDDTLTAADKTLAHAIAYVQKHNSNVLDGTFCENKAEFMMELYSIIIQAAIKGVSQKKEGETCKNSNELYANEGVILTTLWPVNDVPPSMDIDAFKTLLCESLMVFNKTYADYGSVTIPNNQASEFFHNWSVSRQIFVEKGDSNASALLNEIDNQSKIDPLGYSATDKDAKSFTYDIFDMVHNTMSVDFSKKKDQKKIKFSTDEFIKTYTTGFDKSRKINNIPEEGRAMLLNNASLMLTVLSLNENLKKLELAGEAQLGQIYKDQLKAGIISNYKTIIAQTIIAVESTSKILLKGIVLTKFLKDKRNAVRWVQAMRSGNGGKIITTGANIARFASGYLSLVAMMDGINDIASATQLYKDGNKLQGTILIVCAGAQTALAIVGLIQTFGFLTILSPWMLIGLAVVAALASIFAYIFRDKTGDWVPIEYWANRTLFGVNDKPNKWPPYPPNLLGTGICTNDYLAAVQGLHCNIEFGSEPERAYIDNVPSVVSVNEKISRMNMDELDNYVKSRPDHNLFNDGTGYTGYNGYHYSGNLENKRMVVRIANKAELFKEGKGLYVQMTLPKYNREISVLEAVMHINKGNDTMILKITNGDDYPKISPSLSTLSTVALRGKNKAPITNIKKNNTEKVTKDEYYELIKQPQKDPVTGLTKLTYDENNQPQPMLVETDSFKITYKVAEIYGNHQIYLKVCYWQEGKTKQVTDEQGNTQTLTLSPLVQVYHYEKD